MILYHKLLFLTATIGIIRRNTVLICRHRIGKTTEHVSSCHFFDIMALLYQINCP
jgi:hypothetical protein